MVLLPAAAQRVLRRCWWQPSAGASGQAYVAVALLLLLPAGTLLLCY
jgi:hypothetical protein